MNNLFLPWKIKQDDHRLLVQIVDSSGATVAVDVELNRAQFIIDACNIMTHED